MSGFSKVIFTAILITLLSVSFATESTLTLKGGMSNSLTDIDKDVKQNGMIGLSYEIWLAKWISLGIHPYTTKLQAGPQYPEETGVSRREFKTDVLGGDLLFRLRPVTVKFGNGTISGMAPYLLAGAGVVNYYPRDLDKNPLGGDPDAEYEYLLPVLPSVGAGFTFFTDYGIDFDLGFQYQMTASDYLDAWEDGDDKDAFYYAYLGVSHTFGKKVSTPVIRKAKAEPMLLVSQTEQSVSSKAGTKSFDVASNLEWTAATSDSWFSVNPSAGKGDANITIRYEGNPAFTPRNGRITIAAKDHVKTINVYQEAMTAKLEVNPTVYQVTNNAGQAYFAIESNLAWNATENVDWFSIAPIQGNGNGELVVNYMANGSRKSRMGQVVITAGQESQTITITQSRNAPAPIETDKQMILKGVNFRSGSAELTAESYEVLDEAAASLVYYPEVEVEIQGHTDNTGSLEINNRLSLQRAVAVKTYLVNKGISESRMTAKGYGPARPIATNNTPEGRALNRRIEFYRIK